nr:ATPase, T2SS/T4P/T4SS family [Plesiomonas shigelloides]
MDISEVIFTDLYIDANGTFFAKNKEVLVSLAGVDKNSILALKAACDEKYSSSVTEFRVKSGKSFYRVTTIPSEPFVYVLKKSQTKARDFNSIGLSPRIRDFILDKKSTGLVLVGGPMNSGKTSTVATFFQERLNLLGGVGMAIEDPPEIIISDTEIGRCVQVHAHKDNGGYAEQLRLALRTGANFFLIGEIRDQETAHQVINAAMNGSLVFSTIHGDDIPRVVDRLMGYCEGYYRNCIKEALKVVIYQQLIQLTSGSFRLSCKMLEIDDKCRATIGEGRLTSLNELQKNQSQLAINGRVDE